MNRNWINRLPNLKVQIRLKSLILIIASAVRTPLARHITKATPLIVLIAAFTLGLEYLGWLDHFENAGLDTFNILQAPRDPTHLVLVGITDDDYRDFFNETSPLDPRVLYQVIEAIVLSKPRVIGIDIDTSARAFDQFHVPDGWPPLVWGQDLVSRNDELVPGPVLGRQAARPCDRQGVAALPQDEDGVVRRYLRHFATRRDGHSQVSSFPWAVVQAGCESGLSDFCKGADSADGHSRRGLRLNFSGERYNFSPLSIRMVLQAAKNEGWRANGPFRDKVVLLGGCYRAARDSYVTPVGAMLGLQLMAQAVQSELGGGIRLTNHLFAFVLDILVGFALVFIHHRFSLPIAISLSLFAIPVLSLLGSFLAFSTFAWWFNFVPVTIGVLIHQLYDHAREYHRLRQRLEGSPTGVPPGT
jgi:CHASE2 domain-containing sensor protein